MPCEVVPGPDYVPLGLGTVVLGELPLKWYANLEDIPSPALLAWVSSIEAAVVEWNEYYDDMHLGREPMLLQETTSPGDADVIFDVASIAFWKSFGPFQQGVSAKFEPSIDLDPAAALYCDAGGALPISGGIVYIREKPVKAGHWWGHSFDWKTYITPVVENGTRTYRFRHEVPVRHVIAHELGHLFLGDAYRVRPSSCRALQDVEDSALMCADGAGDLAFSGRELLPIGIESLAGVFPHRSVPNEAETAAIRCQLNRRNRQ